MCIWDQLRARATGKRKLIPAYVTLKLTPSDREERHCLTEYDLSATLGTRFWATPETLSIATDTAKGRLAELLYEDLRDQLALVRAAVMEHDMRGALEALAALDDTILDGKQLTCRGEEK